MELGQVSPLEVDGTGNLPVQIDCTGFMLKKSKAFILNLYIQWQDITINDRRAGQKHGTVQTQGGGMVNKLSRYAQKFLIIYF